MMMMTATWKSFISKLFAIPGGATENCTYSAQFYTHHCQKLHFIISKWTGTYVVLFYSHCALKALLLLQAIRIYSCSILLNAYKHFLTITNTDKCIGDLYLAQGTFLVLLRISLYSITPWWYWSEVVGTVSSQQNCRLAGPFLSKDNSKKSWRKLDLFLILNRLEVSP